MEHAATVTVGRMVELTLDERRKFEELGRRMYVLTRTNGKGWFAEYVQCLTEANRLVRAAVSRSHAS